MTIPVGPEYFVGKGVRLIGTTLGTLKDAEEALDYVLQGKVKTIVVLKKLEDVGPCLDALEHGEGIGRFVVSMA
jgi:propanol-preferring alcohol dehydrogenase